MSEDFRFLYLRDRLQRHLGGLLNPGDVDLYFLSLLKEKGPLLNHMLNDDHTFQALLFRRSPQLIAYQEEMEQRKREFVQKKLDKKKSIAHDNPPDLQDPNLQDDRENNEGQENEEEELQDTKQMHIMEILRRLEVEKRATKNLFHDS